MTNKYLLGCGIAGGPLFIVSSLVQAGMRDGFDLSRHHLSTLSLGQGGWVQITTFIVTGLLMIAFAVGLWREFRFGAVCFGIYAVAMILGGIFVDEPAFGFPPGAPAGAPESMSFHGVMHVVGAILGFSGMVGACLAFAWRFAQQRVKVWAIYSAATGIAAALLVFTMDPNHPSSGPRLVAASLVEAAWMTSVAIHAFRKAAG